MAAKRKRIFCLDDRKGGSRTWLEVTIEGGYRNGTWWHDGKPFGTHGFSCPAPKGQKQMRRAMKRRGLKNPNRLRYPDDTGGVFDFRDGVGSFAPRKGMTPRSRPLPAVDIEDEPRPTPRPGLRLCDCGLPAMPGVDMCQRCAMLDYGTTKKGHISRTGGKRATIINILRDRPEGATITEILQDMGEDPGSHKARNSLQIFFDRWVKQATGRIGKRPCIRRGERAVCYELDVAFAKKGKRRRR